MDGSVRSMWRFVAVVAVMPIVAACGDGPRLHVVVERPPEPQYQALIAKTVVTVYESELDSLTCEHIELGDVTSERLVGATVAEQTIRDTGVTGSLDDISRLGKKLVVARLFSEADVLIAAGCQEHGDLDDDVTLTITTRVAATVALDSLDTPTREDPYGKLVTLLDPLGNSLVDREVRWRLFGPAGAEPTVTTNVTRNTAEPNVWDSTSPGCTDERGLVDMHPVPPAKVGGFAARFRVSWSASPSPVFSGFVRPGLGIHGLPATVAANHCALRTNGERRMVCLTNGEAHRYEVVQVPNRNYLLVDRGAIPAATAVGVVAIDEATSREVYAITATGAWQRLFGGAAVTASTCAGCTIDDFRVIPACGAKPARLVMHSTTGAPIRVSDLRGGLVKDFALPDFGADVTPRINSTGCVTQLDSAGNESLVQVAILDFARATGFTTTRAVFDCGARACFVALPFAEGGVGFLRAGTVAEPEYQMVGTSFDIAGAKLIGWVLRPAGDTYHLIERQTIVAAAPPTTLLSGKLDGDDEPDLLWAIRGARTTTLQLSYGQPIEDGSRLSSLVPLGIELASLDVGDLDGNGFDDVFGVGTSPAGTSVVVMPMNVAGPDAPIFSDVSTCQ